MSKVSKQSGMQVERHGPVENHHADVDGYAIDFVSFSEDIDATPLMKGLPDDKCQCPHWGYVFKGRLTFRFADHDEVVEAGDAFYSPPGHVPTVEAGTEYLQFSPSEELRTVSEAMKANMQRMMQGA
jgi:hypothetical protein